MCSSATAPPLPPYDEVPAIGIPVNSANQTYSWTPVHGEPPHLQSPVPATSLSLCGDIKNYDSATSVTAVSAGVSPLPTSLSQAHHFVNLKLTSTNFLLWKTQVIPFLQSLRLLGHIDGTKICPADPTEADYWRQQDSLVMSMLVSSLSEEVIPIVVGKTTSKDIWDSLVSAFASTSTTRVLSSGPPVANIAQRAPFSMDSSRLSQGRGRGRGLGRGRGRGRGRGCCFGFAGSTVWCSICK